MFKHVVDPSDCAVQDPCLGTVDGDKDAPAVGLSGGAADRWQDCSRQHGEAGCRSEISSEFAPYRSSQGTRLSIYLFICFKGFFLCVNPF